MGFQISLVSHLSLFITVLTFRSPLLDNSSKLTIAILRDSLLRRSASKCLGRIDIELRHLLEFQHLQPNNEGKQHLRWLVIRMLKLDNSAVVLSLVDRKRNPSPAKLSVRISQDSTFAVAGNALEQVGW